MNFLFLTACKAIHYPGASTADCE